MLVVHIDTSGCFIENEDRWVISKGPCKTDKLLLSNRKISSALNNLFFKFVGKGFDKRRGVDQFRCELCLVFTYVGITQVDVSTYRISKQKEILMNYPHGMAEFIQRKIANIDARN